MNSKSRFWTIVIIIIIIIAAIWWIAARGGAKTANAVTFVCPSGDEISAEFNTEDDTAKVEMPDGRNLELAHAVSADGARYANEDESFVFWTRGNEAMVIENGSTTFENCVDKESVGDVDQTTAEVRDVVTNFGEQLQNVSLLAPNASSTIAEEYGPYVTPELLAEWTADPSSAPGRQTSSPWPDHIEITSVDASGVVYVVEGRVVLMTSNEVENGGNAGTQDVELILVDRDGKWLINSYTEKGAPTTGTTTGTTSTTTQ